jgi:hypothetical protein
MASVPPTRPQGLLPKVRRFVERLGPYQSLVLLLIPVSLVEPLKLVAVAVAGEGHWITGTAMIIAAYAASLLLVERLFAMVKPKLLTCPGSLGSGVGSSPFAARRWGYSAKRE